MSELAMFKRLLPGFVNYSFSWRVNGSIGIENLKLKTFA
jgi:hypothetical protein